MKKLLASALALAMLALPGLATAAAIPYIPPISLLYNPSGVAPVAAAKTDASCTGAFTPLAGRAFNVSGWGTFVATWQLVRSFDGGVTKLPITAAGTQLYVWTAPASEEAEELEYGVSYYVCVTSYTSGTLNIRISQ